MITAEQARELLANSIHINKIISDIEDKIRSSCEKGEAGVQVTLPSQSVIAPIKNRLEKQGFEVVEFCNREIGITW